MIVKVRDILEKAKNEGYAVGAFNTINLETTQGILRAAKEMKSPIIIQITEKTMDYAGGRMIFEIIRKLAEDYYREVPVGVHLDHGKSLEIVQRAVEIGISSVMYDGSRKEYVDNARITKSVVEYCHTKDVFVQGELGNIPYLSEQKSGEVDWDKYMTDPDLAKKFIEETGIDALAVAIGNAHDFFKEREAPDWERLKKIRSLVNIPLILHGASDWDDGKATDAVKNGISCFNVDTNTRLAFTNALSQLFKNDEAGLDPRKYLGEARDAITESVKKKIELFGSAGKA
ncbi:MAG: class II fructose-bisphosphate aldolase [Patescibacteria group bacterium]